MTKRLALLTFIACLLTACGNKGPLVLPDAPPASTAPAPTSAPAQPTDTPPAPPAQG